MRRSLTITSAAAALALLVIGCSGEEGLEGEPSLTQGHRLGLVHVTYEHDWLDKNPTGLLTTTAQFVRYRALDRELVARMLALPLDPHHDLPALDRCSVYDLSIDQAASVALETETPGTVELLEAGDLEVHSGGRSVTLLPRHFPGLLPFISGVVYGESQVTRVELAQKVQARTAGGASVGSFQASARIPRLPMITGLAGSGPSARVSLTAGQDLSLRWQPRVSVDVPAVTYLELRHHRGDKRDLALRCQVRDDGAFTVPAARLSGIRGRVELELVRLASAPFEAQGLDSGELRVAVKDTAELQIQ